jgi:hypothetical protein
MKQTTGKKSTLPQSSLASNLFFFQPPPSLLLLSCRYHYIKVKWLPWDVFDLSGRKTEVSNPCNDVITYGSILCRVPHSEVSIEGCRLWLSRLHYEKICELFLSTSMEPCRARNPPITLPADPRRRPSPLPPRSEAIAPAKPQPPPAVMVPSAPPKGRENGKTSRFANLPHGWQDKSTSGVDSMNRKRTRYKFVSPTGIIFTTLKAVRNHLAEIAEGRHAPATSACAVSLPAPSNPPSPPLAMCDANPQAEDVVNMAGVRFLQLMGMDAIYDEMIPTMAGGLMISDGDQRSTLL